MMMPAPQTFLDGRVTLHCGDCLDVLAAMPDNSVDSIVADPPYGLEFMGKEWDAPWQTSGKSALFGDRDSKTPGFGVTRNATCRSCGLRLRGKIKCGCEKPDWDEAPTSTMLRQMRAFQDWCESWAVECLRVLKPGGYMLAFGGSRTSHRMVTAIEDAGFEIRDGIVWAYAQGFPKNPAVLKPAVEPICMARKPLVGTLADNVARYGTGALNIDACRIASEPIRTTRNTALGLMNDDGWKPKSAIFESHEAGRWPANLIHDGSDVVTALFPESESVGHHPAKRGVGGIGNNGHRGQTGLDERHGDIGSAARFFYAAKADADDRLGSKHPTIKPVDLIRHLCRLVTPAGGLVLDHFAGTGTTGEAAWHEGFRAILVEREAEFQADIARRMDLILHPAKRAAVARSKNKLRGAEGTPLFPDEAA